MIKRSLTVITDSQIKLSPSSSGQITLIAAPGSSYAIKLIAGSGRLNNSAGVYGNINAAYCAFGQIQNTGGYWFTEPYAINDNSMAQAATHATDELSVAGIRWAPLVTPYTDPRGSGAKSGTSLWNFGPQPQATTDISNAAVVFCSDNNGSGNFTSGGSSTSVNTFLITLYYAIEPLFN